MTKPTLLFAPETFNIAETTRMIEVARAASGNFDAHFSGYGGPFAHLIEEAGFPFHRLEPAYTQEKIDFLWKVDRMETFRAPFTVDEVRARVRSEQNLYARLQPVAVVIGFTLTVYVSARIAGIPLVAVTPFSFTRPFFDAGLGVFPDQFRRGPLRWLPRRWLDAALTRWALRTRSWIGPLNAVLREHGHAPFATLMQSWEADHMLVAETAEVTGIRDLPRDWHYVGPIFAHLPGEVPAEVLAFAHADDRPFVYCAMGSSGNHAVVRDAIEAFDGLPYRVVAPVAELVAGGGIRVPENVLVTGWLPAPKVSALADICVIHGGQGTVQTACAAGLPFVGIGMQPEQEWNIDFLVRRGCAIRLPRTTVTRQKLGEAIERLLHDPQARQAAAAVAADYRTADGATNAARFLTDRFG